MEHLDVVLAHAWSSSGPWGQLGREPLERKTHFATLFKINKINSDFLFISDTLIFCNL